MRYVFLVVAEFSRHRSRTLLTVASIAAAFLLFGLLDSVHAAFVKGGRDRAATRLVVTSRMSIEQALPGALAQTIARIKGVTRVTSALWFGGVYGSTNGAVATLAVDDDYLGSYPEILLPEAQRAAFERTFTGALVSEALAKTYGWKVGDHIPIRSSIFPTRQGNPTWTFDISGVFHFDDATTNASEKLLLFHKKYFDQNAAFSATWVHWFVVCVADPKLMPGVAAAIDTSTDNSDHETRTQTEQVFRASLVRQTVDAGLIVTSIMGAVFFSLLLLTGNVMMHGVRERRAELGVLKAVGFSDASLLTLILMHSLLIIAGGGLLGLALVNFVLPHLVNRAAGMIPIHSLDLSGWLLGLALMISIALIVGALPAWRAMRLQVVDAMRVR